MLTNMKAAIFLCLGLLFAGCSQPVQTDADFVSGFVSVKALDYAPQDHLVWSNMAANNRPPELPPLFDEARSNNDHQAARTLTDERVAAINAALESEWQRQKTTAPPERFAINYVGSYYEVSLKASGYRS